MRRQVNYYLGICNSAAPKETLFFIIFHMHHGMRVGVGCGRGVGHFALPCKMQVLYVSICSLGA
jgi:hypothetical protein